MSEEKTEEPVDYKAVYEADKSSFIEIGESKNADTRSCDCTKVTKPELLASSLEHKSDVAQALGYFVWLLNAHGVAHDSDKLADIDGFHANFLTGFKERDWLDRHYVKNRHHLENKDAIPEDVNLVDVLDHVADQVMAGMGRLGEPRPVALSDELLQKALANTVKLLAGKVRVIKEEETE